MDVTKLAGLPLEKINLSSRSARCSKEIKSGMDQTGWLCTWLNMPGAVMLVSTRSLRYKNRSALLLSFDKIFYKIYATGNAEHGACKLECTYRKIVFSHI
jgi:hypothetical protein